MTVIVTHGSKKARGWNRILSFSQPLGSWKWSDHEFIKKEEMFCNDDDGWESKSNPSPHHHHHSKGKVSVCVCRCLRACVFDRHHTKQTGLNKTDQDLSDLSERKSFFLGGDPAVPHMSTWQRCNIFTTWRGTWMYCFTVIIQLKIDTKQHFFPHLKKYFFRRPQAIKKNNYIRYKA